MSISSEIARINSNVAAAYSVLGGMGADMPTQQDTSNLAGTISSLQTSSEVMVRRVLTLAAMTGKSSYYPVLLANDAFAKAHYADDGFYAVLRPLTEIATGAYIIGGIYHGNRKLLTTGSSTWYGFGFHGSSGGTSFGGMGVNQKISGITYNAGFRVDSTGTLKLVLPANRNIAAGTYELIMGCNG